mmetsp:Transcript_103167/g.297103  ORF Transcript_103167/g.297103 Transcript_103167/m.297103 type:complete len:214 (-) Transcript_103167:249-890(-)
MAARCKVTKSSRKFIPPSATLRERSLRDKCTRGAPGAPHAAANRSTASAVAAEASKAKAFALTIGKIKALALARSMSRNCSRCCLFKCGERLACAMWQNSHDSPLAHCPVAKYKHGREHSDGCPMLPVLQASPEDSPSEASKAEDAADEGSRVSASAAASALSPFFWTFAHNNIVLTAQFCRCTCISRAAGRSTTSRPACRPSPLPCSPTTFA